MGVGILRVIYDAQSTGIETGDGWELQIYDRTLASVTCRASGIVAFEQALALSPIFIEPLSSQLANKYMPFAAKFQVN